MSTYLLIFAALTLQPILGQSLGPSELLHRSALRGETGSIKMLLQLGTDVNLKDRHGRTALHDACLEGHLETARLLLDRGARVDARDSEGHTPLDYALKMDRAEAARALRAVRSQ